MPQWYYAHNEEQFGPVSAAALKEMAQQGKLGRDDLIWRDGMQRWAPAYKVRGLFPELSTDVKLAENNGSSLSARNPAGIQADVVEEEIEELADDVSAADDDDDESDSVSADDETAIDALPLGGPEESKLHVPALGAPDKDDDSDKSQSDELVVFEPPAAPPARASAATGKSTPSASAAKQDSSVERQTRVDLPAQGKTDWAAGAALFLQTFTWVTCLLVILVGGVVYLASLMFSGDPSQRLSASCVYATFVIASYFLARSTERLSRTLGQWFGVPSPKQKARDVRQRNWSRFQ